ncbi:MAG TPA: Clp protease N-terminal domain-containing protein [Ktedonobacterales bacterium]
MNERDRFDKFTERARKVLSLAQEEAQRFNHNYIGTEHLLLGLVREGEGVAAKVLNHLGVELDKLRAAVEAVIGRGDRLVLGEIGLTPQAKKAVELAVDESRRLNHHYIGTEHLLLGLVRENSGIAAQVLQSLGVDLEKVRTQTIQVLSQASGPHTSIHSTSGSASAGSRSFTLRSGMPSISPYQPYHLHAATTGRTTVGTGAVINTEAPEKSLPLYKTLLGWVVVNTGGAFTLTLYHGAEADAPKVAIIANPPTGAFFPYHAELEHGLTYTLEGDPGSVTIMYTEIPAYGEGPRYGQARAF